MHQQAIDRLDISIISPAKGWARHQIGVDKGVEPFSSVTRINLKTGYTKLVEPAARLSIRIFFRVPKLNTAGSVAVQAGLAAHIIMLQHKRKLNRCQVSAA